MEVQCIAEIILFSSALEFVLHQCKHNIFESLIVHYIQQGGESYANKLYLQPIGKGEEQQHITVRRLDSRILDSPFHQQMRVLSPVVSKFLNRGINAKKYTLKNIEGDGREYIRYLIYTLNCTRLMHIHRHTVVSLIMRH